MLIGLDFDNTIVCYDKSIARLADELLDLPPDIPRTKLALRSFFRQSNREVEWTAFQGKLYGPGMEYAEPFDQALETIQVLRDMGHKLCIVSHRSLKPYAGLAYDLHAAARGWVEMRLAREGLIQNSTAYFYESQKEKISAVAALGCKAFLDDLPEVLGDQDFPKTCQAILFDPEGSYTRSNHKRISRWADLPKLLARL